MPIQQFNIPTEASPKFVTDVREALRLLVQHLNNQEVYFTNLTKEVDKAKIDIKNVDRPHIVERPESNLRTEQIQLSGNVTGLIGLLAQGQYTYVPQYPSTPELSDPAVINGSFYFDSVTGHLWFIDHSTTPITFIDLSASIAVLQYGTKAARPVPSASNENTFYFETDTHWFYFSTGANWIYTAGQYINTRATRVALAGLTANETNALFIETDTSWSYYYSGTAWQYYTGEYKGTRATRLALTIVADDNGALFYETDYNLLWRVSAGAWTLHSLGAINVNNTPVSVNASTTADQNLMSFSIPAGLLNQTGRTLRVTCSGLYDVDTAANITWKIKLGGVTILTWLPQTPAGVKTDLPWRVQAEISTTTTGATGNVEAHGIIFPENKITSGHQPVPQLDLNTAVSGAIDLTSAATLQVTIAFDTSSTSNAGRQRSMILELLN